MTRAPDALPPRRGGAVLPPAALALVLLLASLGLVACSGGSDDQRPAATAPSPSDRIDALLRVRAAAVRDGDRRAFLATVAGGTTLRREQSALFDRLRALPLRDYRLRVEPAGVVREGRRFRAVVEETSRLSGFDNASVRSRARYLLVPGPRSGSLRIASTVDGAWQRRNRVVPQPWSLPGVRVVREGPVLAFLDAASAPVAPTLLGAVRRSIADVAQVVPPPSDGTPWDGLVVVSALADPSLLDAAAPARGGEVGSLDGVAYEVPTDATRVGSRVAATRVVLAPRILRADPVSRDRLLRHELTHVALGTRDDRAPLWLQEGLAEWVSTRALPPGRRTVPAAAIAVARSDPRALPTLADFAGPAAPAAYAVSWWACQAIVDAAGESTLWSLLDAFRDGSDDPDGVVRDVVGIAPRWLVARAARDLVDTYAR
ncbi:hypothetical protein K8Z61_04020 [Nocardioides sp. TRM66260-LWL]|uniref:hypothetical protein n=1 Tax=Nocardioides sp. TRM66260-LWL TaxID=2874478 RepID=UPI001CC57C2A|nr:hypothetical protein [Nocardioides sp. TRM66260-LWL]MBZ5733654.1 hypothetical protein [Nocardioides sp. TRM66260-LWL]